MAYQKLNWLNKGETGAIPINKTNLNHMDDGIEQNSNDIANIIESGSNNNGKWIKFVDGTIIQWGQYTIQGSEITWTALTTGLYYSNSFSHKLPVKILENSSANNVSSRSANFDWAVRNATANDDTGTFLSFNLVSATNAARNIIINWFVVARWK